MAGAGERLSGRQVEGQLSGDPFLPRQTAVHRLSVQMSQWGRFRICRALLPIRVNERGLTLFGLNKEYTLIEYKDERLYNL